MNTLIIILYLYFITLKISINLTLFINLISLNKISEQNQIAAVTLRHFIISFNLLRWLQGCDALVPFQGRVSEWKCPPIVYVDVQRLKIYVVALLLAESLSMNGAFLRMVYVRHLFPITVRYALYKRCLSRPRAVSKFMFSRVCVYSNVWNL